MKKTLTYLISTLTFNTAIAGVLTMLMPACPVLAQLHLFPVHRSVRCVHQSPGVDLCEGRRQTLGDTLNLFAVQCGARDDACFRHHRGRELERPVCLVNDGVGTIFRIHRSDRDATL